MEKVVIEKLLNTKEDLGVDWDQVFILDFTKNPCVIHKKVGRSLKLQAESSRLKAESPKLIF